MSEEQNRVTLEAYSRAHDPRHIAADAVYTDMSTGREFRGHQAIAEMLHWFYHVAFDAQSETVNTIVEGDRSATEALVVGRHIGEFAGVPATGRDIRVPIAVFHEFQDGQIVTGRFYFSVPAFLEQVGAMPAAATA
jgi:steroid delta-isomerase-like uncharacterized protein